ncbi:MAG: transposase [Chloroflexi bacterium]|nr:transposase [Chloroflexota bacterium]
MPKRKRLTANQKAQIAIEILKEEKAISQIASEFGVHPNVLYRVKKQTLENLPKLFSDESKGEHNRQVEHECQINIVLICCIKALIIFYFLFEYRLLRRFEA